MVSGVIVLFSSALVFLAALESAEGRRHINLINPRIQAACLPANLKVRQEILGPSK